MTDLNHLYTFLNEELFDGALPAIPCLTNARLRKTLGRCHLQFSRTSRTWTVLKIDIQKGLEPAVLRKTMVHEMCHAWAVLHHQERGHGAHFWSMMSACGYPDGHQISGVNNDAWVLTRDFDFSVGEAVHWSHNGKRFFGEIRSIRKRHLVVLDGQGGVWRISPNSINKERKLPRHSAGQINQ